MDIVVPFGFSLYNIPLKFNAAKTLKNIRFLQGNSDTGGK
jgi:hypothetical protein